MQRRRFSRFSIAASAAVVLAVAGGASAVLAGTISAKTGPRIPANDLVQIKVLSARADLVSGGEALTQIVLPPGVNPSSVRLDVSGQDAAD